MNDEMPDYVSNAQELQWKAFCERYPLITSRNRFKRVLVAIFMKETSDELSFTNGFYRGFMEGIKQRPVYVPPEPISGQPESPGSHSSSHNPTDGSPDANPSK